ncbi:MAG: hypothetical protein KF729_32070 [Sandaracinaceae bacterium]|nr:hypothetical protein [Sandaracinaceae bacterium]
MAARTARFVCTVGITVVGLALSACDDEPFDLSGEYAGDLTEGTAQTTVEAKSFEHMRARVTITDGATNSPQVTLVLMGRGADVGMVECRGTATRTTDSSGDTLAVAQPTCVRGPGNVPEYAPCVYTASAIRLRREIGGMTTLSGFEARLGEGRSMIGGTDVCRDIGAVLSMSGIGSNRLQPPPG